MIQIRMCADCWRRLASLLARRTRSEAAHLQIIAAHLETCPECASQARTLRFAVRSQSVFAS